MRRKILVVLVITLLTMLMYSPVYGVQDGMNAEISLPTFDVTLNGQVIDNGSREYPLLVYKDITYFPMTYNACRYLGLETSWKDSVTGLGIEKTNVTAAYEPFKAYVNINDSVVTKAPFPVKVNGKTIDNSSEEYPLLLINNVTYFPLTWRFAVDEFGWDYSFSHEEGLVINSDNIRLEQKALHGDLAISLFDGNSKDNVIVTDEYVFYEATEGRIMMSLLSDTTQSEMIYQLPVWSYGDGSSYVNSGLYVEDGDAYLSYHQGGATMGADVLYRLNSDGSTDLLNSVSRKVFKYFGNRTIRYYAGPAPNANNLYMKTGDGEWEQIGDPDQSILYGWAYEANDTGGGGGTYSKYAYIDGDDLYILGYPMPEVITGEAEVNGIYRINVLTNETTRLSDKEALTFRMDGDYLYYPNEGGFYRITLADNSQELIKQLDQEVYGIKDFQVLGGRVYWQDETSKILYDLEGNDLNQGGELVGMKLSGDNNEYLVCTFEETSDSKYRIMVFDRDGQVVFKTSDRAYCRNISIRGHKIYFYNITTGTVCIGQMK